MNMHLAPKQILINAHMNLLDSLKTAEIVKTSREMEESQAGKAKVDMIFLETARVSEATGREPIPEHTG